MEAAPLEMESAAKKASGERKAAESASNEAGIMYQSAVDQATTPGLDIHALHKRWDDAQKLAVAWDQVIEPFLEKATNEHEAWEKVNAFVTKWDNDMDAKHNNYDDAYYGNGREGMGSSAYSYMAPSWVRTSLKNADEGTFYARNAISRARTAQNAAKSAVENSKAEVEKYEAAAAAAVAQAAAEAEYAAEASSEECNASVDSSLFTDFRDAGKE
jgi:hypothetical protein